ncbi:hypothetical protein [Saccharicrinis sp. GN24d3]|uniref:hypothetical protein n=1 Tax=Saccharicrinis sp. GN24d3 TaxID=3458416 RepID=UPI004035526A
MKLKKIKTVVVMLLAAIFVPISILAQQNEVKITVHKDGSDSTLKNSFYSTMFDVQDLGKMHEKLDSIFSTLDKDLDKKIKVMAFNADSMRKHFNFNTDFDFKHGIDSMFTFRKLSLDDKRIEKIIDSYHRKPGKRVWVLDEKYLDSLHHKGMNIKVKMDSVTENGRTVIKKEILIEGKGKDGEPIVIKRYNDSDEEREDIIAYHQKHGVKHPGEHVIIEKNNKRLRPGDYEHKHVEEIAISDAEILVKGGISPKVITAPALKPKNIEVNIKVKEEFGKQVKTIGMSLDFEDKEDLQVLILARDGQVVFDETLKNFSGTYIKDIEINEAISPYYFVVIRDKKMFGRLIQE